mgnify:CR=1 FL=1
MSSSNFFAISTGYGQLEVVPNGEWKENFRNTVETCLEQFCYVDMFPVDIMGVVENRADPIRLLVFANKCIGKSIEIREPRLDDNNRVTFESALYVYCSETKVEKRILVKGKKFETYLNLPEEPKFVMKGEFATTEAFLLKQKVDDLLSNLKLFSSTRVADYTPTMVLDIVLEVLQIEKAELKNLELPDLKLKIQEFEIIEAFSQLQHECSVFLSEGMVRYESPELSLEMIPAKQRCNLVYKDFQNFNVELVEKLYDNALKCIIDLQHEIANYSN